ncbi:MAG TPA: cytidine deaminase, partial [Firmicutes bacterium]|nr:cytidine deaminase [Bacillota bacterium]
LCRSVHAEANAIISAPRSLMIGSTLYLACRDAKTGELVPNTSSCAMCKRMIINAGIETVIVRNTREDYSVFPVQQWIDQDESLDGTRGY